MDKQLETLDLGKIRKNLQIEDEILLHKYLKEIWGDLSKRSNENEKGITKVIFNKYYDLPGIISERLFSCLDKDKNGILSLSEFVSGLKNLYSQEESFDSLAKFIFNLYDFSSVGKIKKEDVRVVLSYVPLQKNEGNTQDKPSKDENIHLVEEKFEDRVESQEQLFNILNLAFKSKDEMNFEEYINVVKNVNSDIFILILMFLLEKKPFSNQSIQLFAKANESPKKNKVSQTPKMAQQKIATPSMQSRFLSPKLKKKTLIQKKGAAGAKSILELYSGVDNKKVEIDDKKGKKKRKR
jgi:Ca2+-binding EF-hand superfamily protein